MLSFNNNSTDLYLFEYDRSPIAVHGKNAPDEKCQFYEGAAGGQGDLVQEHLGQEDQRQDTPIPDGVHGIRSCYNVSDINSNTYKSCWNHFVSPISAWMVW